VAEGSVLDEEYVAGLGGFDVVYSWGVLHHTGSMWRQSTLPNEQLLLAAGFSSRCITIRSRRSVGWRHLKRLYCSGAVGRASRDRGLRTRFRFPTADQ
jgi:2-polyprenyl-6-hydroxyphenyl methylase/3-demethylubiquinone-9 3-methyltransferase